MLPFPILLEYGNSVQAPPTIEALYEVNPGTYLLYSTGELFYRGRNTGGKSGIGTGIKNDQWYASNTNVQMINFGDGPGFLMKTDGSYWITASSNVLGISGYVSSTWSDCTSKVTAFAAPGEIKAISGTSGGIVILKTDGTIWVAGSNTNGQLGLGATSSTQTFTQVAADAISIYCSTQNIFYINSSNQLFGTGYNNLGQLGDGTVNSSTTFKQLTSGSLSTYPYVHSVSGISSNTILMCSATSTSEKVLLACGSGSNIGLTTGTSQQNSFVLVPSMSSSTARVIKLSPSMGSAANMFVLTTDGLYFIGNSQYNQSGIGSTGQTLYTKVTTLPDSIDNVQNISYFGSSSEGSAIHYNNKVYSTGAAGAWGSGSSTWVLRTDTPY